VNNILQHFHEENVAAPLRLRTFIIGQVLLRLCGKESFIIGNLLETYVQTDLYLFVCRKGFSGGNNKFSENKLDWDASIEKYII
jgi:hypothetical protein